ncbi:MAG: alpha/beta hydrolase [Chloroflexi bacterium]|nr:alpha/beta hydrolase [Chloroflexota bacterium]
MSQQMGRLASSWTTVHNLPMHARVSVEPAPAGCPVVVLVHGVGVSSRYMIPTAQRLGTSCRVYAPDLPGFGLSGKLAHALTLRELSDVLADWMQATGLDRAALLGDSFGCQVVAEFAVRHPERIEQAVLVGPTVDPQGRTFGEQARRWLINTPYEPATQALIVLRDYRDCGLRRAWRTFQFCLQDHIEEKLPLVQAPTLVVRGSHDAIVPQRWAEEVTRLLPHGKLVVIPGAAHTVNSDAPLELARVALPFLWAGCTTARREQIA